MAPTKDAVKDVQKRIKQHQRGIFCRAEMWSTIETAVTGQNVHRVLDSLSPEEQSYLRTVYAEWPPSLWSFRQPENHPLCAAIESWCLGGNTA